jgi:hypothetical protein
MSELKPLVKIKSPRRFDVQIHASILYRQKQRERNLQTYTATEDDLWSQLFWCWEVVTLKNGKKTFARKYQRQAIDIIIYHSKSGQVKDFIINEFDLRRELREELSIKRIGGTPKEYYKIVDEIFFNAVRRLFEELDLVYYQDHLAGRLRVRLVP